MTKATDGIPKNPTARRAWVGYQLKLRGTTFAELARQEGVSGSAVRFALLVPSYHLEEVIAGALGLTARDLFPERFDATGRRLGPIRPRYRKARPAEGNVQNSRAA
ncbi:MAG: helix-turn-helix domain-containing protein [Proteobacteria bacterium]|nr:helix-turn-helix domain-containing protein [Pseudomonadota bacterium]